MRTNMSDCIEPRGDVIIEFFREYRGHHIICNIALVEIYHDEGGLALIR